MASTYSTNLKIELITPGEQSGAWGTTTNNNFSNSIEQAIVGRASVVFASDADLTLTLTDQPSSVAQDARAYFLAVTSGVSLSTTRSLILPAVNKPYVIDNATTGGQAITVSRSGGGTTVTVPNGSRVAVYCTSGGVSTEVNHLPALTVGATAVPVVTTTATQTLTNKTLTAPIISAISNSGTVTIPTGTSTLLSSTTGLALSGGTLTGTLAIPAGSATAPSLTFSGDTNTGIYRYAADQLSVTTNGVEKLRIDASGRIGAGTTIVPGMPLALTYNGSISGFGCGIYGGFTADNTSSVTLYAAQFNIGLGPSFAATSMSNLYLTSMGVGAGSTVTNVYGINIESAIDQGAAMSNVYAIRSGVNSGTNRWNMYLNGTADNYISGNVGIGVTSPTAKLDIVGDAKIGGRAIITYSGTATTAANIELYKPSSPTNTNFALFAENGVVSGSITRATASTVAYNTSSDYRLKEERGPIEDSLLRLDSLRPIRYAFKSDPSVEMDGFFAHEVQPVVPVAVTGARDAVDDAGDPIYQQIDHSKLVPLLVAAVQELSARVKELESRQ